jgi:hypothetical protein
MAMVTKRMEVANRAKCPIMMNMPRETVSSGFIYLVVVCHAPYLITIVDLLSYSDGYGASDGKSGKSSTSGDAKAGKSGGYSADTDDYGNSNAKSGKSSSTNSSSKADKGYHMFHDAKSSKSSSSNGYGYGDEDYKNLRRNLRAQ